jgi:hypothetical protein
MSSPTDLRAALKNMKRGVENELETHNANQLSDSPVFDRTKAGRREKLNDLVRDWEHSDAWDNRED